MSSSEPRVLWEGRGWNSATASNVSYICYVMLYGASLALCIALGDCSTAQVSASCGCGQLCRPGTSCLPAWLPLSYAGWLCCWFCLRSSALYGSYFASCFVEHTWRFAWPAVIAVMHHTLLPVAVVSFVSQVGIPIPINLEGLTLFINLDSWSENLYLKGLHKSMICL